MRVRDVIVVVAVAIAAAAAVVVVVVVTKRIWTCLVFVRAFLPSFLHCWSVAFALCVLGLTT